MKATASPNLNLFNPKSKSKANQDFTNKTCRVRTTRQIFSIGRTQSTLTTQITTNDKTSHLIGSSMIGTRIGKSNSFTRKLDLTLQKGKMAALGKTTLWVTKIRSKTISTTKYLACRIKKQTRNLCALMAKTHGLDKRTPTTRLRESLRGSIEHAFLKSRIRLRS